jgi:hypothetical protein
MERRGFFTRRGDALRGDIMVPAKVYEAAHAIVLEEQHRQAAADVGRETERETRPEPEAVEPAQVTPPPILAPVVPVLLPLLPDGEPGSLVARFRAAVPAPENEEAHRVLAQVLRLVQVIARVLGALVDLVDRFRVHEEDRGRRMAAKLEADGQLHDTRIRRAAARQRLEQWEAAHPLRMWAAKAAGSEDGKPVEWRALHREATTLDRRVQEIKNVLRRHRGHLDDFDHEAQALEGQQAEQQEQLRQSMRDAQALNPSLVDTLMSVAQADERAHMEKVASVLTPSSAIQIEKGAPLELRLAVRSRPVSHP